MSQAQGFPGRNPADDGGMTGTLRTILDKFLQSVDDCLPAKVISYDRRNNVATVQPQVAVLTTDNKLLPRASVASVPVLSLGCGQFMVNFPLRPGDLGWLKATDRDISLFVQGLKETKPNTTRKHSFEDGFFIPNTFRNYTIEGEDFEDNMVIQSLDGAIRVSLWPDRVKITAGESWMEVNRDGTGTWTAPQKVFFDTPLVEFAGVFKSGITYGGGMSEMDGGLKTTQDQIAGGVSTMHHPHSNTQPGAGQSGPPVSGSTGDN